MLGLYSFYDWVIENKEIVKIFYGLVIAVICIIIVIKTDKLFRLSLYQGIRYLRNAFFFFGIAFIIRYVLRAPFFPTMNYYLVYYPVIKFVFEYFLVMAGFFLFYSLLWKRIEEERAVSSLFNTKIAILYVMALVIVFLDLVWETHGFMFFSQIILFSFASFISYMNYKKNGLKHRFLKFYFIAMLLSLIAWILNMAAALWLDWNKAILIDIYILNIIIFLLFLYGVINVTKIKNKE